MLIANSKNRISNKALIKSIIIIFVLLLILISVLYYTFFWVKETYNLKNNINITETPTLSIDIITPTKPVYIENPINGTLILDKEYNLIKNRPFLAVIIQNNIASRPLSGLNEADVIYEALVESNITRFLAIYWSKDASRIQSIRSARHYFVELLGDYGNPVFMHIGYATCVGVANCNPNVDALTLMNKYKIRRLSDLRSKQDNQLSFFRDLECQKVKAIEHCAYSTTSRLWEIALQQGWINDLNNYGSWLFSDTGKNDGEPLTSFIINFETIPNYYDPDYSVKWVYDSEKGKYLRFNLNGTPYLDFNGEQVYADVLIYQRVNAYLTGDSKGHVYQNVIGSGDGYVMQNGQVFKINWSKKDFYTKTQFIDITTGKDFEFKRGKLWINILPKHNSYQSI